MLLSAAFAADLNCNGYDELDEALVDLSDAQCAANLDPATGLPYPTADSYYDYVSFGCNYLLEGVMDRDRDGFGAGTLPIPGAEIHFECDVCPTVHDPEQLDEDFDEIGDYCEYPLKLGHSGGLPGTLSFSGAMGEVTVFWSDSRGFDRLDVCGGQVLRLSEAEQFGAGRPDAVGGGVLRETIRKGFAARTMYFQAVELDTCRTSAVIEVKPPYGQ